MSWLSAEGPGRGNIFFLDEDQQVTMADIGTRDEILKWAAFHKAEVVEMELPSQFRCNGSDGYLAWLDHLLQIRMTANESLAGIDYDFRVCDSPTELRELIVELDQGPDRARLVAGYCWDWISKQDAQRYDIAFPQYGFAMQWNLADDGQLWLLKEGSLFLVLGAWFVAIRSLAVLVLVIVIVIDSGRGRRRAALRWFEVKRDSGCWGRSACFLEVCLLAGKLPLPLASQRGAETTRLLAGGFSLPNLRSHW